MESNQKGSGVAGHSTREINGANGANSIKGAKASNGANGAVSNVPYPIQSSIVNHPQMAM